MRRNGGEVQSLADEVAQGDDKFGGVDYAPFDHIQCGLLGQTHLLFGTQQDDV